MVDPTGRGAMDLVFSILVVGGCCGVAIVAGSMLASRCSQLIRRGAQVLTTLALVGYLTFLWDQPLLARLLPYSGLIILSNWLPILGSFLVGMYLRTPTVSVLRRRCVGGLTVGLAAYSVVAPTFGEPPDCQFLMPASGLQYQSTPYTCSAACAASLLAIHEIETSEREMAELCLTRQGTHWMGLYRGLMLKTAGTEWTVRVEPFSLERLSAVNTAPAVLALNLEIADLPQDTDHGFQAEVGHSVVALDAPGQDLLTVFDPSPEFGLEVWSSEILRGVKSGVMLSLEPVDLRRRPAVDVRRKLAVAQRMRWLAAGR